MKQFFSGRWVYAVLFQGLISISAWSYGETKPVQPSSLNEDPDEIQGALTEILVKASDRNSYLTETHHKVTASDIQSMSESDVSGLMNLVPSASLQTNSRGETLVFMRNAGERQVAVFLDGALLNVPWDNRIDLSLIPASAIGGIDVYTGGTSVQFGANVAGGALEITTLAENADNSPVEVEITVGEQNLREASLTYQENKNSLNYLASLAYARHDGIPLTGDVVLPFNQVSEVTRTNTDSENLSLLLRGNLELSPLVEFGITTFFSDVDKGVAPQGHLDPDEMNLRFWRYPESKNFMTVFNGRLNLNEKTILKSTFWAQKFDQTIISFTDSSYSQIDEKQLGENLTIGTRLTLRREFGPNSLLIAFNGLSTEHEQKNSLFSQSNNFITAPVLEFGKRLLSLGTEYEAEVSEDLVFKFGLGLDWMTANETGDKPSISDFLEYNATLGAIYHREEWSLRAGFARKTRLPTLRELFGTSLNRFLLNPDLQPESNLLGELAFTWRGQTAHLQLAGFTNFTSNTIDQRMVFQQGRSLRQRVNLRGSRVVGVEVSGDWELNERFTVEGHLSLMNIKRRKDNASDPGTLAEKPKAIGRIALHYQTGQYLSGMFEVVHRGRAFSPDEQDRLVPLEISTIFNIRMTYSLERFLSRSGKSEVFIKLNNVTDALVESQLGLPAAGRWFSAGVRLGF